MSLLATDGNPVWRTVIQFGGAGDRLVQALTGQILEST